MTAPSPAAVLPTGFLPPVTYFHAIVPHEHICIDGYEHFRKQTIRNRCLILSANGVLTLVVPVAHRNRTKTPVKDIRIAEGQPWKHRHWNALCSAYNRSPYFEHYRDDLHKILFTESRFLFDLNERLLEWALREIGLLVTTRPAKEYLDTYPEGDYRLLVGKKNSDREMRATFPEYMQVFSDRFGFVPDLSIIDLLSNTGSKALNYLGRVKMLS